MIPTTEQNKTHLRDYWRVIWRGRWTVLSVGVIIFTLVAVATFMQTEIYRATVMVEVQPRSKSITPNADFSQLGVSSWSWAAEDKYLNTQMEVIRSKTIAGETLSYLGLYDAPQFADLQNPAEALSSGISVRVLADTYIVELSVDDADPAMAQLLANGIAKTYIDLNVTAAVANTTRVINELLAQIEPMKDEIAEKEQERIDLSRAADYYAPDAQESSIGSRMAQLERELTSLQIALGERESVLKAIKEIEEGGGNYDSLTVVANDSIIIGLKEEAYNLEQELEELSAAYKASHPKTVAVRVALNEVPRKITAEAERIITKARTEYAVDQRRVKDLQRQLKRAREEGLGFSQTFSEIETLDAEIRDLRRIYELINSRIKEISLNQDTLVNNLRVLESASKPVTPVRPRKALNLAAGLLLGMFLGIGTVFFIDYLDNTIRDSEDIEHFLGLPLLSIMPKSDDMDSMAVRESLQTLRTSILFASKGRTLKSILVTSAGSGEGKSRTSVNLAKTLAAAGDRVLLVDADLRRPTVHKHLGLPQSKGLSNYMMNSEGGDTWRHFIKKPDEAGGLSVLTCGPLPPKPVELFGSERFKDFLTQIGREFAWVVIDSPPVASLADTLVLGSLAEMTVFVIQHMRNDRNLILRSVEQLRNVDANLVGAVLNSVDLKRAAYGDYYYASEYVEVPEGRSDKAQSTSVHDGS